MHWLTPMAITLDAVFLFHYHFVDEHIIGVVFMLIGNEKSLASKSCGVSSPCLWGIFQQQSHCRLPDTKWPPNSHHWYFPWVKSYLCCQLNYKLALCSTFSITSPIISHTLKSHCPPENRLLLQTSLFHCFQITVSLFPHQLLIVPLTSVIAA